MAVRMHDDELPLAARTVRHLLAEQFPEWAGLPVRRVAPGGTVNAIFRIGTGLAARFPLQPQDASALRERLGREARAAEEFARCSPFTSPTHVAMGDPGPDYPLPWSVQSWVTGTVATQRDPGGDAAFAGDLARLVLALRGAGTGGRRFQGPGRGGDLQDHDRWMENCLRHSAGLLDVAHLEALWGYFRELPRSSPDVMAHGDLIPANVLVSKGRLVGVLDCGGFGPADPALDLIAGWHLLEDGPRAVFRARVAADELEWERSKAWAFEQAMGAVWYYVGTNPTMSSMGRRTLQRIVAHTPGRA